MAILQYIVSMGMAHAGPPGLYQAQARNSAVHSMRITQDPSVLHLKLASDSAAGGLPASCENLVGPPALVIPW